MISTRNRFHACLLGGALGDALGGPVEQLDLATIRQRFGPEGITELAAAHGRVGAIGDGTQMTLFTADGLLRAHVRGATKGICHVPSMLSSAYRRWLLTQGHDHPDAGAPPDGWLCAQPELHHRRGAGRTCLAALRAGQLGERADNDSKGTGGVTRVAPVGLWTWHRGARELDETFELGGEAAALTHGHPTGILAAGVVAALTRRLIDGAPFDEALDDATACLRRRVDHEETLAALGAARELAGRPRRAPIDALGAGWVAEEALAMAVYAAKVADGFEGGVRLAVNHGGDSDATGALTGQLLGAQLGVGALPPRWLAQLELREVIAQVADDLYDCTSWRISEYDTDAAGAEVIRRYPGH